MADMVRALAILAAFALSVCAFSQPKPCGKAANLQSEKKSENLRTWNSLHKSYRLYGRCDNVSAQEGYSESIARILVDHWGTLPRLALIVRTDQHFKEFVLGGVNATLNTDDVEKIKANALQRCPSQLKGLCDELSKAADDAIKDAAQ
jgi:hypothetical protein